MLNSLKLLPTDPILGLSVAFKNDTNPNKVDLGVGVYKTETGETPVMAAVKQAETIRLKTETSKAYIGPAGNAGANQLLEQLIFGSDHTTLKANRIRSVQTPGGCGALRVAGELINRAKAGAKIWVSNPTWANHIPLLGEAGLEIAEYPYYNYETHSLDFDAMMATLKSVPAGDLVLLHACCHNPSGADLNKNQWNSVADLALENGFTVFIDMAYQGFGAGLEEDAYGVRLMAEKLPELILASSCSKNFGLYRERTGMLTIVGETPEKADATFSNIANVARGIYSMPPAHGSAIVEAILSSSELTASWQSELSEMRTRIHSLRSDLVKALEAAGAQRDFEFIASESGMFSFLGLTKEQVQKLIDQHSIYMVGSSRINVAGLSSQNLEYVAKAIVEVL